MVKVVLDEISVKINSMHTLFMAAVYHAEKRKGNGYKYSISTMLLKAHVFPIALQETQKGFREKTINFFRLK